MSDGRYMANATYRRAGGMLEAEIGDELVTLDVAKGDCFGFNEVATRIWRSLAEPRKFLQLRDELLAEYDVGIDLCTRELQELLDDLAAKGLVEKIAE